MNELKEEKKHRSELKQANQRLKVLGQLEAYREEKIAKEMFMLEMKRKEEEDRIAKQIAADKKKAAYIEK